MKRGEHVIVDIESMTPKGDGLAVLDGREIVVPRTVPGDRAEVPESDRVSRDAYTPQALALEQAAESGAPFCEACEKAKKERAAARG